MDNTQQLISYKSHQKVVATVARSYNNLIKAVFADLEKYVRENSIEVNKIKSISAAKLLMHMRAQNVDVQNKLEFDLDSYLNQTAPEPPPPPYPSPFNPKE